jgi:Mn2+/Fe2+ NRAMP family transporter
LSRQAWRVHPDVAQLTSGFIPTVPDHDVVRYSFLAISIVGATVSPYLLNFYASGTVEEKLTEDKLWVNRTTAFLGIGFGIVVSMGVLVTAAVVLAPRQIQVNSYEQAALMFVPAFGRWAVGLFAAALGIGCFGAAVEIALNGGYVIAQVLGWRWGADKSRSDARGFSAAMTAMVVIASAIALPGFDPLQVTMICVALTVVIMPAVVLPFLVLMNDPPTSVGTPAAFSAMVSSPSSPLPAQCMALIIIPLEIFGG